MNGQLSHPHLLLGEKEKGGSSGAADLTPIPIPKKDFDIVRGDLRDVVAAPHGTGHPVDLPFFAIAGKTGTAQVVSNRGKNKGIKRPKADSWFVGFGPFDDPRIVVAVLIENGGDGGDVAGPVAREIFRMFYITRLAEKGNPAPAVAS